MPSFAATKKCKRKSLTLHQKYEILLKIENKVNYKDIMEEFNIKPYNISKRKRKREEIMENMKNMKNFNGKMKRIAHKSKFQEVNNFMIKFIESCGDENIPINGPTIKMMAQKYASKENITNFMASDGWLNKILYKNKFALKNIHGEEGEANFEGAKNF